MGTLKVPSWFSVWSLSLLLLFFYYYFFFITGDVEEYLQYLAVKQTVYPEADCSVVKYW